MRGYSSNHLFRGLRYLVLGEFAQLVPDHGYSETKEGGPSLSKRTYKINLLLTAGKSFLSLSKHTYIYIRPYLLAGKAFRHKPNLTHQDLLIFHARFQNLQMAPKGPDSSMGQEVLAHHRERNYDALRKGIRDSHI